MLYKPNRKETKQIKNLNKAYNMMRKAFEIVMKNAPKNDGDISVYAFRASKNIDKIIERTGQLLEARYVDKQFKEIVKYFDDKKRGK
jgi:hypothetical protein